MTTAKVSLASKAQIIPGQEFAAPDRAIGPQTRAIESDADDQFIEAVLGHATGQVRMMMLHGDQGSRPGVFSRVPR